MPFRRFTSSNVCFTLFIVVLIVNVGDDAEVDSANERVAGIIFPKNVRFGIGGGSVNVDAGVASHVIPFNVDADDFEAGALVTLPAVVACCVELRRIFIDDADGGANMNLLVIGSAVFLRNSIIEAFVGITNPVPILDLVSTE